MKKFIASLLLLFFITGCATTSQVKNKLYQVSTLKALSQGVFEGSVDLKSLQKHGNFGIGTFSGLGGELIMSEGKIFKVDSSGSVYQPCLCNTVPLALVTFFNPNSKIQLNQSMDFQQLQQFIVEKMNTKNIVYSIKVEGEFEFIKTRSVPQYEKPYPKLSEAVKNQKIFEFSNVKGTMIGFWFPKYFEGINMPGFHFHFLNENNNLGGHMFDCKVKNAIIEISEIRSLEVDLPSDDDFNKVDLVEDISSELKKSEANN